MKPGDLFTFDRIIGPATRDIDGKSGIFLGERPLKRVDGIIVPNFAVLLLGESTERLCDASMKRWMKVIR